MLALHSFAHSGMQFLKRNNLHGARKCISQTIFEPSKIKQSCARRGSNEYINIARGMGIAAREGAKQGRADNTKLAQNRYDPRSLSRVKLGMSVGGWRGRSRGVHLFEEQLR